MIYVNVATSLANYTGSEKLVRVIVLQVILFGSNQGRLEAFIFFFTNIKLGYTKINGLLKTAFFFSPVDRC